VAEHGSPLDDFPLFADATSAVLAVPSAEDPPSSDHGAATLSSRVPAAAADGATVLLLAALAILAARLSTGSSPKLPGLAWAAGFALYLSAFATIVPLVAFGRTVGMALADLNARPPGARPGVPIAAALRRWLGTIATAGTGGLLLLWTARNDRARTPADRLSGCALTVD